MAFGVALAAATATCISFASAAQAADVALGPVASTFGVLAGAGVTNTGNTTVSGNVGTSPNTSVTGFPPGKISHGTEHVNDGVAKTGQSQTTSAYLRAAAEPTTTTRSTIGNGETLKAGVYESGSSLQLNGSLTLDGEGKTDAMFVFKAGSTLNAASSSTVNLVNGANACNVYWQVGSSATLETTATFRGTILALTSISAKDGAHVTGRLLARNGAVSLIDDHITVPDCSSTGGGSSTPSGGASSSTGTPSAPGSTTAGTPTVSGVSPGHGSAGGGTAVTVTGTGFVPGHTTVTVGGTTIPTSGVHVTSPTRLTVTLPAHGAGRVDVTVHTPRGTSRPTHFTYVGTGTGTGTTTTSTLANTGPQVATMSELAVLLLLGGTALLYVSRRRAVPRHRR